MPSEFQKLRPPPISYFKLPLKIICCLWSDVAKSGGSVLIWGDSCPGDIRQYWGLKFSFFLSSLWAAGLSAQEFRDILGWMQSLCLNKKCAWLIAKILQATIAYLVCQLWQITIITEHPTPKCGYMRTVALCLFLFFYILLELCM